MNKKKKILVVDDEKDICVFFQRLLKNKDVDILLAHSGEQALRLLREQTISVVLLDLVLPDTNGMELLKEIKVLQPFCVVIMMTGLSTTREAIRAIRHGAYDFLMKPFDSIDELEKLIGEAADIRIMWQNDGHGDHHPYPRRVQHH
ncbi:response regulator [Pelotomaculum propionicicum]|uniref:response regulator n=1 Tax=Pelotomaculum propionicicum TaxID=258475 RepID=UPI003BA0CC65